MTMSEVVIAIDSATILVPDEPMQAIQWLGAVAILITGLIEVSFWTTRAPPPPKISIRAKTNGICGPQSRHKRLKDLFTLAMRHTIHACDR